MDEKLIEEKQNELIEKAIDESSLKLIVRTAFYDIKDVFQLLVSWFIGIVSTLKIFDVLYYLFNDLSNENQSLEMIEEMDSNTIIFYYCILGLIFILVSIVISIISAFPAFISHLFGKYTSNKYKKNRQNFLVIRNTIYALFIVIFLLISFTEEQLGLVSTIITLALLFKIIFKKDNILPNKELEKIINNSDQELKEKNNKRLIKKYFIRGEKFMDQQLLSEVIQRKKKELKTVRLEQTALISFMSGFVGLVLGGFYTTLLGGIIWSVINVFVYAIIGAMIGYFGSKSKKEDLQVELMILKSFENS